MTKISDVKQGPIRAVLEANRKALSLFSQKEQNNIVRTSMQQVGNFWIAVFFPRRFTDYARRFLNYNPRASWETAKVAMAKLGTIQRNGKPVIGPQPTPLVLTGQLRETALLGVRGVAKATKNRAHCVIRIPMGHAVRKETSNVLRNLPAHEVTRLAGEFKRSIVNGISESFQAGRARQQSVNVGRRSIIGSGRKSVASF